MTEETVPTTTPADVDRPKRQHALAGQIATGAFLLEVLLTQVPALRGAAAWDRIGGAVERSSLLVFFEIVFVLVPFAFYLAIGAKVAPRVQQVTGILLGLFLVVHFVQFPAQHGLFGMTAEGSLTRMTSLLSRTWAGIPVLALLEITGIGLACFHLALALLATGRSRVLCTALAAVLFVVGSASVVGLATGSAFLPPPSLPDAACGSAVETPSH
jgi:hypothetical protein